MSNLSLCKKAERLMIRQRVIDTVMASLPREVEASSGARNMPTGRVHDLMLM
jgi:hypothetical protein